MVTIGQRQKTQTMIAITKEVAKSFPNGALFDKTLLWIRVNQGLSPQKAEQYLNDVIETKGWVVVDGRIKAE